MAILRETSHSAFVWNGRSQEDRNSTPAGDSRLGEAEASSVYGAVVTTCLFIVAVLINSNAVGSLFFGTARPDPISVVSRPVLRRTDLTTLYRRFVCV